MAGDDELSASDIAGIIVGSIPAVIALANAIVAYCTWRYPTSRVGKVGTAISKTISLRGGHGRGGDATGAVEMPRETEPRAGSETLRVGPVGSKKNKMWRLRQDVGWKTSISVAGMGMGEMLKEKGRREVLGMEALPHYP
ncbi:hypothetical protein QQZ08_004646 [Neonectria magnoliae]|uniref:Uncharacterized protein n=1 Tax=Neonectria magnoliae TaxID=2732573 RepID=A0ABR1I5T8_9HYPO